MQDVQGFMYSMPALLLLAAATAVVPVVAAFQTGKALAADRHNHHAAEAEGLPSKALVVCETRVGPCAHSLVTSRVGEVPEERHRSADSGEHTAGLKEGHAAADQHLGWLAEGAQHNLHQAQPPH